MSEHNKMFEEFADRDREQAVIAEILERTAQLLDSDSRSRGMTYAESTDSTVSSGYGDETLRRATRSAVENMMVMIPMASHEIDRDNSYFRSLIRQDDETELSTTYGLGEVRTHDGMTTRWMALVMSDESVQRARGVILTGNGLSFTSDEIKSAPDEISKTAYRLTQKKLRPYLTPILNGRLLPGQELPKTLALIRNDIEASGHVKDVDYFMNELSLRYFKMSEAREFRESMGFDSSEMSIENMQALSRYLNGDVRAIGLYDD
jgi:hypothetical protein